MCKKARPSYDRLQPSRLPVHAPSSQSGNAEAGSHGEKHTLTLAMGKPAVSAFGSCSSWTAASAAAAPQR